VDIQSKLGVYFIHWRCIEIGTVERKEREKLVRKTEIINAAERVFFEKGFESSTMEDIAKEAEFTKKTLYSYFKSKDELYFEIMLSAFNLLNELLDNVLEENNESSETEKIKEIGKTFIIFSQKHYGYFKAIADYENKEFDFQINDDNSVIKKCYIAGQHSIEVLNNCILSGIKKGEFIDYIDSYSICLMLWSSITGYIGLVTRKEKYIKAYFDKTIDNLMEDGIELLLRGIKK
jgi:AcrR family transcriptional regulator